MWPICLSRRKSVLCLSFLLLQADSPFEVRIWDHLLQSTRKLRIKHFKVPESVPSNGLRRHKIVHRFGHLHLYDPQLSLRTKNLNNNILRSWKFVFQNWNAAGSGNLSKWTQPYKFADKLLLHERERIPSWNIPCTSWCKNCKALSVIIYFMNSRYRSSCV